MEQLALLYDVFVGNNHKDGQITMEDIIFNKKNTYNLKVTLSFEDFYCTKLQCKNIL